MKVDGISYCAVCDAFFYRGKNVAVLGGGQYAINEALELKPIANSVTILTNGSKAIENRSSDIDVIDKRVKEIKGKDKIDSIEFEDNSNIMAEGVFIAEGTASSIDFARKLGIIVKDNIIVVNEAMQTNIPAVYAAGDCTGGILQISKAVYDGTKAGLSVINYLRKEN